MGCFFKYIELPHRSPGLPVSSQEAAVLGVASAAADICMPVSSEGPPGRGAAWRQVQAAGLVEAVAAAAAVLAAMLLA